MLWRSVIISSCIFVANALPLAYPSALPKLTKRAGGDENPFTSNNLAAMNINLLAAHNAQALAISKQHLLNVQNQIVQITNAFTSLQSGQISPMLVRQMLRQVQVAENELNALSGSALVTVNAMNQFIAETAMYAQNVALIHSALAQHLAIADQLSTANALVASRIRNGSSFNGTQMAQMAQIHDSLQSASSGTPAAGVQSRPAILNQPPTNSVETSATAQPQATHPSEAPPLRISPSSSYFSQPQYPASHFSEHFQFFPPTPSHQNVEQQAAIPAVPLRINTSAVIVQAQRLNPSPEVVSPLSNPIQMLPSPDRDLLLSPDPFVTASQPIPLPPNQILASPEPVNPPSGLFSPPLASPQHEVQQQPQNNGMPPAAEEQEMLAEPEEGVLLSPTNFDFSEEEQDELMGGSVLQSVGGDEQRSQGLSWE